MSHLTHIQRNRRAPLTLAAVLLLAAALLYLARPASAAVYCVDKTPCPDGVPLGHESLGIALDAAADSGEADTIEIGASDAPYKGHFLYNSGSPLTIVGAGAGKTVLTGNPMSGAILDLLNQHVEVSDLEVRVPSDSALHGLALAGEAERIVVRQIGSGPPPFGLELREGGSVADSTVVMTSGTALFAEGPGDRQVRDSRFYSSVNAVVAHSPLAIVRSEIHSGGIGVWAIGPAADVELESALVGSFDKGIEAANGAAVVARFATIVRAATPAGGTGVTAYSSLSTGATSVSLESSIVHGFSTAVRHMAVTGATVNVRLDHSAWNGSIVKAFPAGGGAIEQLSGNHPDTVPEFVNPDPINPLQSPDYRLRDGSALIDAAALAAAGLDLDGQARPLDGDGVNGPVADVGAYEHGEVVLPGPGTPSGPGAGGGAQPGTGQPGSDPVSTPSNPGAAGIARAMLGKAGLRLSASGRVGVPVACSAAGPCVGTVELLVGGKRVASRGFALAAGARGTFPLRPRPGRLAAASVPPRRGLEVRVRSRQLDGTSVLSLAKTRLLGLVPAGA